MSAELEGGRHPRRSVAVVVGSLRRKSYSRRVASAVAKLAPPVLRFHVVEIAELPLYNEDLEGDGHTPEPWASFRGAIAGSDAVLFATPEYNRSVPGVLKNAIDVGSRPYGRSVWDGKPAAVITVSPGAIGGFGANHHLRQSLVFLNMPTLLQPEAYIGHVTDLIGEDGGLIQAGTAEFLTEVGARFADWIEATGGMLSIVRD